LYGQPRINYRTSRNEKVVGSIPTGGSTFDQLSAYNRPFGAVSTGLKMPSDATSGLQVRHEVWHKDGRNRPAVRTRIGAGRGSPTLLAHARRDQERVAAQERRDAAAQELVRAGEQRAIAHADLNGAGHRLAREVLAEVAGAAAERKVAAIKAEDAARATAVARARRPR